jgi:hypothetical protein
MCQINYIYRYIDYLAGKEGVVRDGGIRRSEA